MSQLAKNIHIQTHEIEEASKEAIAISIERGFASILRNFYGVYEVVPQERPVIDPMQQKCVGRYQNGFQI